MPSHWAKYMYLNHLSQNHSCLIPTPETPLRFQHHTTRATATHQNRGSRPSVNRALSKTTTSSTLTFLLGSTRPPTHHSPAATAQDQDLSYPTLTPPDNPRSNPPPPLIRPLQTPPRSPSKPSKPHPSPSTPSPLQTSKHPLRRERSHAGTHRRPNGSKARPFSRRRSSCRHSWGRQRQEEGRKLGRPRGGVGKGREGNVVS